MKCNAPGCGKEIPKGREWIEKRGFTPPRTQGGTNHLALPRVTGKVWCEECIRKSQQGIATTQASLL